MMNITVTQFVELSCAIVHYCITQGFRGGAFKLHVDGFIVQATFERDDHDYTIAVSPSGNVDHYTQTHAD